MDAAETLAVSFQMSLIAPLLAATCMCAGHLSKEQAAHLKRSSTSACFANIQYHVYILTLLCSCCSCVVGVCFNSRATLPQATAACLCTCTQHTPQRRLH
jgi:hypothetical protein